MFLQLNRTRLPWLISSEASNMKNVLDWPSPDGLGNFTYSVPLTPAGFSSESRHT